MRDRPFLTSAILGLGVILMTLVLTLVGPRPTAPLPDGYLTPILALEFARSTADVAQILGADETQQRATAAAFDMVNRLDFIYIIFYGLMLLMFAVVAHRLTGDRWALGAAALAVVVMAADVLENLQLLAITREFGIADIEDNLSRLWGWTWFKWGGLAVCLLLLVPVLRQGVGAHRRLSRAIAVAAIVPAVLVIPAYRMGGLSAESLALSIGLVFLLLTIFSWRRLPLAAEVAASVPARLV